MAKYWTGPVWVSDQADSHALHANEEENPASV